jgi:hypothetical protein
MKIKNILLTLMTLVALGCAPAGTGSPSTAPEQADVTGYAVESPFNETALVDTVTADRLVTIKVPLKGLPLLDENALNHSDKFVSKLPGMKLALANDNQGNKFLVVTVPAESLAKARSESLSKIRTMATATLPNGNPLPGFAGTNEPMEVGSLPLGGIQLTLYISGDAFAVFASGGLSIPIDYSFPITDQAGKTIGILASVAPVGGYDGGFYVSFVFPPAIAALLGSLFP